MASERKNAAQIQVIVGGIAVGALALLTVYRLSKGRKSNIPKVVFKDPVPSDIEVCV